jgi:hypothetical protein
MAFAEHPAVVEPVTRQDLRQLILDRLKVTGGSVNWLSQQQHAVHAKSAQRFLYCGRETSVRVVEELLAKLGLVVVPAESVQYGHDLARPGVTNAE